MNNRCPKIPFRTKAVAQYEIKLQKAQRRHFSKKTSAKKNSKKLRIYECPRCGCFHLTTQKSRTKR